MLANNCALLNADLFFDAFFEIYDDSVVYDEGLLRPVIQNLKLKCAEGKEPLVEGSKALDTITKAVLDLFKDVDETKLRLNIIQLWNEEPNASRSSLNNTKLEDLDLQEIPNIGEQNFQDFFKNEVDWRNFLSSSKRLIINAKQINPLNSTTVNTNEGLNYSIIGLQEWLAKEIANHFGLFKGESNIIYKGKVFNEENYDNLIKLVTLKFAAYKTDSGKYEVPRGMRDTFNKYFLLVNFDKFINKFMGKIIGIDPNLYDIRILPTRGVKYSSEADVVKQQWDDEKSGDLSLNTSSYVKEYITSLEEINSDGEKTGRTLLINEFNNLITLIKNKASIVQLANMRDYPDVVCKEIFDDIKNNPGKYFNGNYSLLENTFYTIYSNVFSTIDRSLYSMYSKSSSSTRNDLYFMICDQIGKTSAADYVQTSFDNDSDVNAYVTTKMTSETTNANKSALNRRTLIGIYSYNYQALRDKYHVRFLSPTKTIINNINDTDLKIKYVEFTIPDGRKLTIELGVKNSYSNNKEFGNPKFVKLFNDVLRASYSEDFYRQIIEADTRGSVRNSLINYVGNIFLSSYLNDNGIRSMGDISNKVILNSEVRRYYNYDPRLKILKPDGFNDSLNAVEALAQAISYENKELIKSNVKNSEGSNLSKTSLTSLGLDDMYQLRKDRKMANEGDKDHPIYYNIFTNSDLGLANFYKTEVTNFEGETTQVKNMSARDLAYEQFVFGYLINKKKKNKNILGGTIQVQPNQYSDKSKILGKILDLYQSVKYTSDKFSIDKTIAAMSDKEIEDLYYYSIGQQMEKLESILKRDYDSLFSILNNLYGSKFKTYDNIKDYKEALSKLEDNQIYEAILAAKVRGIKLEIIPEIHYSTDSNKKKIFNQLLDFYIDSFTNPESFRKRMYSLDVAYAESLRQLGVVFDTTLSNGRTNKAIKDNVPESESQVDYLTEILGKNLADKVITSLGGDKYSDIWIDSASGELRNYIALDKDGNIIDDSSVSLNTADKVVINPELRRYRLISNLISDNYNLATTGLAFFHPSKVKASSKEEIGLEEGARTVSLNKRGVIHGATIHPWAKNKMDGIPQIYNLSVIKDLEALNMGVMGDNGAATQADGAIWKTPLIAIWEQRSLPELKTSYVQAKPIGYSYKYDYLSSTLLKCATFTITNANIRSSVTNRIKMDNVIRNMIDNPWIVPNLDFTDYFREEYFYTDPNSSLEFYYGVEGLEKVGESQVINGRINNVYKGTVNTYDNNGVLQSSEERTFNINSNYDLWKVIGGAYSGKFVNGRFIHDESSWEEVADIASQVNIYSDSPEIEEYNRLLGNSIGKPLYINNNLTLDEVKVQNDNNVIPTRFLKFAGRPYFQPMKYSDVHYLANASAVKNGANNINPASLYYNSVATRISPNDKLIFGHPTLGKTQAEKMGYDILDFDSFIREENNEYIRNNALEGESRGDTLKRIGETPEYQQFVYDKLKEALTTNRQVFFSKTALLRALNNPAINVDEIKLDKLITMSEEDFVRRDLQRGAPDEAESRDWKHNLDIEINTYLSNNDVEVIDATGHNLYEYLGSSMISSEFDPNYLGLQLIAEHDIDNEEVSEMTQVISALMQNTYTAREALKVLEDIGDSITNELSLYTLWNINDPRGRAELNRIMGKALVRTFATREGQEISLASAYLDNIKEELYNSDLAADLIPNIPFDDNNILGMFETSFANGFNKDIIKRKFPGFAAVLNPSQDMFTVYDYKGQTITAADFRRLGTKEQVATLQELLSKFDVEVPVSEIREGDWIMYNGVPTQVGILTDATEDGVTLQEIRNLRGQNILKLGSRGRNLRSQNYKMTVLEPEKVNTTDLNFDIFDLDSVVFAHNIKRFLKLANAPVLSDSEIQELDNYNAILGEIISYIDSIYYREDGSPVAKWDSYVKNWQGKKPKDSKLFDEFKRYIQEYVQYDLANIREGRFHVPRRYRIADEYVHVSAEYQPNELAVGKPWATKFLLEEGDNLADVNFEFFKNKLKKRTYSPIDNTLTQFYYCANNYTLNFATDSDLSKMISEGYKIIPIENPDIIANQKGKLRRVNSEVYIPVEDGMRFYKVITPTNVETEVVTGYTETGAKNIWMSHAFYNNVINYPRTAQNTENKDIDFLIELDNYINGAELDPEEDLAEILAKVRDFNRQDNHRIDRMAAKMNQSFQEALRAIAARIPAQSMQSFMNMKIVGFIETDSNVAFVPVNMLQYEGSDFKLKFLV